MNSADQSILSCLLASLNQGEKPWLVTVVATIGSSPRPVGSLVAFRADGSQVGSVSGGCVEEDLIARLLAGEFNGPQAYLTEYGVSAEDNEKWGLPCGGRLELAIQQLDGKDLDLGNRSQHRHVDATNSDPDRGTGEWRVPDRPSGAVRAA